MKSDQSFEAYEALGHDHAMRLYSAYNTYSEEIDDGEYKVNYRGAGPPDDHLDMMFTDVLREMEGHFVDPHENGAFGLALRVKALEHWFTSMKDAFYDFLLNGLPEGMALVDDDDEGDGDEDDEDEEFMWTRAGKDSR